MINREDVLRELELLPRWQLRPTLYNKVAQLAPAEKLPETAPDSTTDATQKSQPVFDYFQSENNAWVFICPESRIDTASQSMLLNNIFSALQIKVKKYDGDLAAIQAKVLIAMGETVAKNLLNSTELIESLRGKQYLLHNLPLIVTYSAAEILEHLPNKAKTWDDLCMALAIVNA